MVECDEYIKRFIKVRAVVNYIIFLFHRVLYYYYVVVVVVVAVG